jgi:hypothetical protein
MLRWPKRRAYRTEAEGAIVALFERLDRNFPEVVIIETHHELGKSLPRRL